MLQNVKLVIQIENVTHMGLLISQQVVSSDIQGLLGPQPRSRGSHSTKVSVYSNKSRIRYDDYYTSCESTIKRGGHPTVVSDSCYLLVAIVGKNTLASQLMDSIKHQSWLKYLSSDIALVQCVDILLGWKNYWIHFLWMCNQI